MRWILWGMLVAMLMMSPALVTVPYSAQSREDLMDHVRNLGKAFYENPTTQLQAIVEFKKALDLAPDSAREHVNYGLALLRGGKTPEGIAELTKAQKMDPKIPHTWFNLGIEYKRESRYDLAIQQFEQMVHLVPEEPVSHYNLGVLYKLTGRAAEALNQFQIAARLNPNLAGPHFQLYNAYRASGREDEAGREFARFQEIKKRQAGAAIPEDLEWSAYAEIYETIDPEPEDTPPGELTFADTTLMDVPDPDTAGLVALDADGDGQPDLLVWSSKGAKLFKGGRTPTEQPDLEGVRKVISIVPGDFNNDGFADLCVLTEEGASLYVNEKGVFKKSPIQLPPGRFTTAVWLDFDHDNDVDLFLFGDRSALARNNGIKGFGDQTGAFPFVPGRALSATSYDLVADTNGNDLVVTYQDRPAVLYRDKFMEKYEPATLDVIPAGATLVTAYDFNNDGWTDLAAAASGSLVLAANRNGRLVKISSPAAAAGPIAFADFENRALADLVAGGAIFRNQGSGKLVLRSPLDFGHTRAVAVADFDGNGRVDMAFIAADGKLHLATNTTSTSNKWLGITLTGVKNPRLAAGAKVEVKAGRFYQKERYAGIPLLFGLQASAQVDTVRITWPNGLIQNQPKVAADTMQTYREAQRLSGSCPMVFAWNGRNFEFITDVLGVAPLGASAGDGKFFPVDHRENVRIPGSSLIPVDGGYQIRITEELREVSYLDRVQLMAVDHRADTEIYANDKFKGPPFPEFRLFGIQHRHYPVAAHDDEGRDVLVRLLKQDRTYPDEFRRNYAGVAEMHSLDLDFGKAAADNKAVLILSGWVDWADGSTFLGALQEKEGGLVFPYLQVKDQSGRWQTVIEDMGIPAGKPKTIAVDLTGKFLTSSREVRIVTNLCVYWDEIYLSEDIAAPAVRITPVNPDSAELRFRGFSQPTIDPLRKQPEAFDYSRVTPVSMWNPTPGNYTRYGDVRPLLESVDDRLVIMGSGDEVRLRFPVDVLPALPDGWKRDFLLFVDGWAKDGDANTAFSHTVTPLPFHGMTQYPYFPPERYPNDEMHRLYQEQYNTRPALRLLRPLAGQGAVKRVYRRVS